MHRIFSWKYKADVTLLSVLFYAADIHSVKFVAPFLKFGGGELKCKFNLALSHIVVCLSSQLGASYFQLGVQSRCNLSLCFPLSDAQSSCDTLACLSLRT